MLGKRLLNFSSHVVFFTLDQRRKETTRRCQMTVVLFLRATHLSSVWLTPEFFRLWEGALSISAAPANKQQRCIMSTFSPACISERCDKKSHYTSQTSIHACREAEERTKGGKKCTQHAAGVFWENVFAIGEPWLARPTKRQKVAICCWSLKTSTFAFVYICIWADKKC